VENDGLGRCNCMLLDQRHIARTRAGANSFVWWKDGVEKNGVLFAHVPEPIVCMVEGRGGKDRCSFRTRAGANSLIWWQDGVGKNCVLFAHVLEPKVFAWVKGRGGKERCSFAHVPESIVFCGVKGRGGKEMCSFCTRADAD
jgi:hypothetical protein